MKLSDRIRQLEAEISVLKSLDPVMAEGLELLQTMEGGYSQVCISHRTVLGYDGEYRREWSTYTGKRSLAADTLPDLVAAIRKAAGGPEAEVAAQLDAEDAETERLQTAAIDAAVAVIATDPLSGLDPQVRRFIDGDLS